MELFKIEKLIEKYLEAETTLEEEKILKDYFMKEDIPLHLSPYKSMFNYFDNNTVDALSKSLTLRKKSSHLRWLSVAATVFLVISSLTIYQYRLSEKQEAKQAYLETQKALQFISFNLNKGNDAIAQLQTFNSTQNKIFKK